MTGKPLGDSTPVSPLDYEAEDDASSVQSTLSQQANADVDEDVKVSAAALAESQRGLLQVNSQRLAPLRLTQHEVEWQFLEEQMRPRAPLPRFPAWMGPSSLGGACFQEDFQMLEQDTVLGDAMKADVHRCTNISSDSAGQQPDRHLEVLIRPLISHDSRRSIAQQRWILEKLTRTESGAIQLQRAYADSHRAYLVFRAPGDGCCLSHVQILDKQGYGATAVVHAVMKALSEVHAAGVCMLDVRADSIWVSGAGTVTFLDFSMAHEFVPGEAEYVCALPALRLTQQHAAPEVVSASLANDVSGRLTPFNGPKADVWAVGRILGQMLLTADSQATTHVKQTSPVPSALQRLLTEMIAEEPAARPDASQALQQCRKLLQY